MFSDMYYKLLYDVKNKRTDSVIYKHHIDEIQSIWNYYDSNYLSEEPNQIVTDFIASMTDDYFIDLYELLFPNSKNKIVYRSYFEDL